MAVRAVATEKEILVRAEDISGESGSIHVEYRSTNTPARDILTDYLPRRKIIKIIDLRGAFFAPSGSASEVVFRESYLFSPKRGGTRSVFLADTPQDILEAMKSGGIEEKPPVQLTMGCRLRKLFL